MSKKNKYKPVKQDEILDISLAISQAAALLDQAAAKGLLLGDEVVLLDVADRWIKIAELLSPTPGEEHVDVKDNVPPYGFGPEVDKTEKEVQEDE